MPRYLYRCNSCLKESTLFHLSDEVRTDCPKCEKPNTLTKALTSFTTRKKVLPSGKVGQVTEEFIQDARQELQKQHADLKDKR